MATVDVNHQVNLREFIALTDLDVANLSDEAAKQMLMDLRPSNLITLTNDQISSLPPDDACRMLLDARNLQRARIR